MRVVAGSLAVVCALAASSVVSQGCAGDSSVETNDDDGSGGSTTSSSSSESGGAGGTGGGGECDPETETCDGVDNDCDEQVDEDCDCSPGATQPCYSGPRATKNVGACKDGVQTCTDRGTWGACRGEVTPGPEECNMVDDDCNGQVDDMGETTCGVGACAVTVTVCENGQQNECVPGTPTVEVCDGLDNDCDQLVDESFPELGQVCQTGQPGICSPGTQACQAGVLVCVPDLMAVPESCNGLDDDCNGTVDDNILGTGGVCTTGYPGVCAQGTFTCQGGTLDCFPNIPPSPEVCDGLDNDCDDEIDEDDPEGGAACDTGQPGACGPGIEHCVNGAIECVPNAQATPETCNGQDDNCDGTVDEGNPGGGMPCGCNGTTACVNGNLECQGGPVVYFEDNFSGGNNKGWTLGPEWQIGPAQASSGCNSCPGNDPDDDHTPTADDMIAGVLIGQCTGYTLHSDYCLESPSINTSSAPAVFLQFWRHLHSDYPGYMTNRIQASTNGGASWSDVWVQTGSGVCINDNAWTKITHDLTAYKSAQMRVRFCFSIGLAGVYASGSWNIDDVIVSSAACQ